MSSLQKALGGKPSYGLLKGLDAKSLKDSKNVVLLVIDGMGYNFVVNNGGVFKEHLKGKMTSVFPPTTASAITSILTGDAPQQHGLTGWNMNLKEFGVVSKILRFAPRCDSGEFDVDPTQFFGLKSFADKIKVKSYGINRKIIVDSKYNTAMQGKAKMLSYTTLDGFFRQVKKAINLPGKKFVFGYWDELDLYSHEFGPNSKETKNHYEKLSKKMDAFLKGLKDTTVIITADHGFTESNLKKTIKVKDHPKFKECLSLPLCGESRSAYWYVHPAKAKQFEGYVKKHFKNKCWLLKAEDAIKKRLFGLGKPNPKLIDRIGDYVMLMKDNYVIKDFLFGQKEKYKKGYHGGVSDDEMYVPLVVFRA